MDAPTPQPPVTGRASVPLGSGKVGAVDHEIAGHLPRHRPSKSRLGTAATVFVVAVVVLLGIRVVIQSNGGSAAPAVASSALAGPTPSASGSASASASASPTSVGGPNDPSGVPMPKGDTTGWRQTFADDFTGDKVSKKWATFDGQPLSDPAAMFVKSHVSQSDGMVTIGGWQAKTAHGTLEATGGMSNVVTFSQTYGKYDVRYRMDSGWGVAYALLLWPSNDNPTPEIDFAEDNGKDRAMTSATLHPVKGTGSENHKEVNGDFTTWHTAEVIWEPGKLVYSIDGKVWATMTGGGVPHTPMSISLQTQSHACGDTWEACPNGSTPAKVNLQVDWVTAYKATKN